MTTISVVVLVAPYPVHAQSGVRYSRDRQQTFISKDVGQERWSITQNSTGLVSGVVYFPQGGDPLFIECDEGPYVEAPTPTIRYTCYGANKCMSDQCSSEEWSYIGDVELPIRFFAPSSSPAAPTPTPQPPPQSQCRIYGDSCSGVPESFRAAGGEVTFDTSPPRASQASYVEASRSPSFSSGTLSLSAGPQLIMGFAGNDEVLLQDGRLVFANREGPGGGICVDSRGAAQVTIRAIEERVDFCAICEIGGPVVGRFSGRYQLVNGGECLVTGEFRMFRTR